MGESAGGPTVWMYLGALSSGITLCLGVAVMLTLVQPDSLGNAIALSAGAGLPFVMAPMFAGNLFGGNLRLWLIDSGTDPISSSVPDAPSSRYPPPYGFKLWGVAWTTLRRRRNDRQSSSRLIKISSAGMPSGSLSGPNWGRVDRPAPHVVGGNLFGKARHPLNEFVRIVSITLPPPSQAPLYRPH